MDQTPLGTYDYIALDAIRPSTTNPRKHFDQAALDELTASIRENGVTVPILLRPEHRKLPNVADFEIVTGERRYRAAKAAGLTKIPAVVREMSDGEARELQMVENLQRADLHPVELERTKAAVAEAPAPAPAKKVAAKKVAAAKKAVAHGRKLPAKKGGDHA